MSARIRYSVRSAWPAASARCAWWSAPVRVTLPRRSARSMLFQDLGCEVIAQDPASHDRAMAHTHALAFFIAKGLVDMGVDDELAVAPPSFLGLKAMLAAVRGDAGHLFAAIQQENPFAEEAREQLLQTLQGIHRRLVAAGDDAGLAIDARTDPE